MIIGIGNDLIDVRRVEKTLERFGIRFEERVFTPAERAKAKRREGAGPRIVAATYAKRFAAKEACAKALGTGFSKGVYMRDIEVVNLPSGQPVLNLSGGAALMLSSLLPQGKAASVQLTLTDDYPMAQALVIISAV